MTARYNFEKPPKNVAFRSTSCMQCGPNSGSPNSESSMPNGRWRAPHDDWPVRAERGGFEPPKPVSQFNGLANRRQSGASSKSGKHLRSIGVDLPTDLPTDTRQ